MIFLSKAKQILTDRDYKLINVSDLKESRKNIVKRIRMYRDEIRQSNDNEFIKVKERKLQMLLIISDELKVLIETL